MKKIFCIVIVIACIVGCKPKMNYNLSYDNIERGFTFTPENPASIEHLKYTFLYDKNTGHFVDKNHSALE